MKKDKNFFHGHARFAEERARLFATQQAAADFFGVSRVTWGQCERGNATPSGDVLAGLALKGADVLYILTGERAMGSGGGFVVNEPAPEYGGLSREELALVDNYRHSNKEGRAIIRASAAAAQREAAEQKKPAKKKSA